MNRVKSNLKKLAVLGLSAIMLGSSFAGWQFAPTKVYADEQIEQTETQRTLDASVFLGSSVVITSDLSMQFAIQVPTGATGVKATVSFLDDVREVALSKGAVAGDKENYQFTYNGVSAQHMADQMTVRVEYDLNSIGYYAEEITSVKEYCEKVATFDEYDLAMPTESYENLIRLVTDMLNYGAAAQIYTEYDVENLANANVEQMLKDTDVKASEFTGLDETDFAISGEKGTDVIWKNPSVVYGNTVSMAFNFKLADGLNVGDFTLKATKGDKTTTLPIVATETEGVYSAQYKNVYATDFDTPITAQVYKNDVPTGYAVTYSIKSFAYNQQHNATTLADLAKATYLYGQSAVAFNGSHVHNFTQQEVVVPATCTTPGSITNYCEECGDVVQVLVALGHDYDIKEETIGVQTFGECAICHTKPVQATTPALYHDYEVADQIGENTNFFDQKGINTRFNIEENNLASSSNTVDVACRLSTGDDFLKFFYGGAGVKYTFHAEQAGKAVIVIKASSGYIVDDQWKTTAETGDMVFNKVFDVALNGQKIDVADDVILEGKGGGTYAVCVNWMYIPLEMDVKQGENVVELTSLQPLKEDGSLLYKDAGANGTQSNPFLDTIAVYTDVAVVEGGHSYVSKTGDGLHWQECEACGDKQNQSTDHDYQSVVTEVDGVQKIEYVCVCGDKKEKSLSLTDANYVNLGASNLAGTNSIPWAAGEYATRTSAIVRNSGSTTVQQALNKSTGGDFITQLYGGSRIEVPVSVSANTTGTIVVKASSGWINNASWSTSKAKTGDMQFNLIFKAYVRHANGSTTQIEISDAVVLKGATGNYSIMANWNYVVFDGVELTQGDVFVLESLCPKTQDGKYVYWDGASAPKSVSDGSCSKGDALSSPHVDTVALYLN